MSQQETFMDKYIFEGFSHQWPYNMFVLVYLVQQNEEYMRGGKKRKKERNWARCLPYRNIPYFSN